MSDIKCIHGIDARLPCARCRRMRLDDLEDLRDQVHHRWVDRLLGFVVLLLVAAVLLLPDEAEAAEFPVCWENPSETEDGTELTDLRAIWAHVGQVAGTWTQEYELADAQGLEGEQQCADIVVSAPGTYFVALTAVDAQGDRSDFSNVKQDEAVGSPPDPPEPQISLILNCELTECIRATVVAGVTGEPLIIRWDTEDRPFVVRIYAWPSGTVPVAQAERDGPANQFTWTPARAGIYYATVEGPALTTGEISHLIYIQLAAPDPGGIE